MRGFSCARTRSASAWAPVASPPGRARRTAKAGWSAATAALTDGRYYSRVVAAVYAAATVAPAAASRED